MFLTISKSLENMGSVPMIIISISLILFLGFAMTRVTKLLKLPNVTAYIIVGILLGPYCFKVIPNVIIEKTDFLSDIALAFIAFGTGEFFKFDVLKKNGSKVMIITILESLMATFLIFILCYFILKLPLAFSLVLAALAAATAPASTMMTIRQTGAKGDFVETLLQVVALDDIIALIAYSIAISIAVGTQAAKFDVLTIVKPLSLNLLAVVIGGLFGVLLKALMPKKRTTDNKLIIGIATLFAFCGLCTAFDVSPLLGCMAMGTVYSNIMDKDDKFFKQMNYFSPPILLIFFVRSGLNFDLNALISSDASINGVPLLLIGVLYFFVRIVGKYIGAYSGCLLVKKPERTRNYLGLALIPQAGVAIGLAALGARTLGDPYGSSLETIIIASSVLYELIGPACAKLSLYLSKSYSNNLEEITEVSEIDENGKQKSEVEILIERIASIQANMPKHDDVSEEEKAFTEASLEQYGNFQHYRNGVRRKYNG